MHLQVALRQSGLKLSLNSFRFFLGTAVYQPIICIPTPWEIRVCPRYPEIERVMHKEVGQNWTHYATLRGAAATLNRGSVFLHHGRLEPSFDVQQGPLTRYVLPDSA